MKLEVEKPVPDVASDVTERDQRPQLFKPGQSGNPAGRPKGSRSRISEKFLTKLEDIFERRGDEALEKAVTANPMKFISMIAGLLPAQLEARMQALVEHRHEFGNAESIADVLELVANEAGAEAALKLADAFGLEDHLEFGRRDAEFSDKSAMALLPKEVCPFDPSDNGNYRDWHRRHYGRFPDELDD
jgi:hypothetical protein